MKKIILLVILISQNVLAAKKTQPPKETVADVMKSAQASDWRTPSPDHVLYMELDSGRVIMELAPEFAPEHFANIKILAKDRYWDGLAILRVQDNYVVQWGDPNAEDAKKKKSLGRAQETLPAEFEVDLKGIPFSRLGDKDVYADETGFSNGFKAARNPKTKKTWLVHCYGAVGVGRDVDEKTGSGAELYVVIGHGPRHLDRNVVIVGRVLQGVELLSSLRRGHGKMGFYEGSDKNTPIKSVRFAADVPETNRTRIEVLKTDTPLFARLIEAQRNRQEDWFKNKAGHIDICNMPVAVRTPEP